MWKQGWIRASFLTYSAHSMHLRGLKRVVSMIQRGYCTVCGATRVVRTRKVVRGSVMFTVVCYAHD
jgi:hypothetical protein